MRKILFLLFSLLLPLHSVTLYDEKGNLKPAAEEFIELFGLDAFSLQGKERWLLEPVCEDKLDEALPILKRLGCIDSIYAQKKHYQYALVLGSLKRHMQMRLDFLYEEWKKGVRFDEIVLLTGQRDLNPERELYPKDLKTETDLFVYLLENHPLKEIAPFKVIDSPKIRQIDGTLRRPDTATTVRDWKASDPKPGSILVVSTQPFVGYQHAVLRSLLPCAFDLETIGPETGIYPMALYLDNFAKWMLYESR